MKKIALILLLLPLAACTVTAPKVIPISGHHWHDKHQRVGIIMTEVPDIDIHIYGANCFSCVAAAKAGNSSLSNHTEKLSDEQLPTIKQTIAGVLEARNIKAIIIDETLVYADLPEKPLAFDNSVGFDFSTYKTQYNLTHLLVIDVTKLGLTRGYFAHFPVTGPRTIFAANTSLVDLDTDTFDYYQPIEIEKTVLYKWDEPPKYPALTNSYYQVLEEGKDAIINTIKATQQENI